MTHIIRIFFPIVLLFSLALLTPAQAQDALCLHVTDAQGKPLRDVTVRAVHLPDSLTVDAKLTDSSGYVCFKALQPRKAYTLELRMIGYTTQWVAGDADSALLQEESQDIEGVQITARRQQVEMKNGQLTANVAGTPLAKSLDINALLGRLPGMYLDGGELKCVSSGKIVILLDGRKLESTRELQALDVDDIDQVQVDHSPSALYEKGTGVVLSIKTKNRRVLEGFALNFTSYEKLNHRFSHDNTLYLRYQLPKVQLFAQGEYYQSNKKYQQDFTFTNNNTSPVTTYNVVNNGLRQDTHSIPYAFGLDAQPATNHELSFRYNGSFSRGWDSLHAPSIKSQGNAESRVVSNSKFSSTDQAHDFSLFYNVNLSSSIHLSLVANALYSQAHFTRAIVEDGATGIAKNRFSILNGDGQNLLAGCEGRLDLALSDAHKLAFSMGCNHSQVDYKHTMEGNTDLEAQNTTTREERPFLAVDYTWISHSGFSINTGLRYEHPLEFLVDHLDANNSHTRKKGDLSPFLSLEFHHGNFNHTLSFRSYITRPSFRELGGESSYLNQFMTQTGNPNLIPQQLYIAKYNLFYKFIYVILEYDLINNSLERAIGMKELHGAQIINSTTVNVPLVGNAQCVLVATPRIGWYSAYLNASVFYGHVLKKNIPDPINPRWGYYVLLDNTFSLPWDISITLGGIYMNSGRQGITYFDPDYNIYASIQKSFLDGALTIALEGNDFFLSSLTRAHSLYRGLEEYQVDWRDTRYGRFILKWRFNNYKAQDLPESTLEQDKARL